MKRKIPFSAFLIILPILTVFSFLNKDHRIRGNPRNSANSDFYSENRPSDIKKLVLWINAFIPKDITGQTTTIQGPGPYFGQTALSFLGNYYLTDQRTFSSDIKARQRMQSLIEIDFSSKSIRGSSNCSETVRINSGFVATCNKTASTDNLKVTSIDVKPTPDGKDGYYFSLKGGSKNPCVEYVPNAFVPEINWLVNVIVIKDPKTGKVFVNLDGTLEPFPAFEMYGAVGNKPAIEIFTQKIGTQASPYFLPNLPAGYSLPADITVSVTAKEIF